jgi:hypothetical protein
MSPKLPVELIWNSVYIQNCIVQVLSAIGISVDETA